jgi:hypothetical protein
VSRCDRPRTQPEQKSSRRQVLHQSLWLPEYHEVDASLFDRILFTLGRFNYGLGELVVNSHSLRSISDTLKHEENEPSVARSRQVYIELVVEALLTIYLGSELIRIDTKMVLSARCP